MGILIKSPFHSNSMETDQILYGLRPVVILDAVRELYNDRSILITGTRGIGKSSLSYQLQQILTGSKEVLIRCGTDIKLPKYITIDYICDSEDTLELIVLEIINKLEEKIVDFNVNYGMKISKFDINLFGAVKAQILVDKNKEDESKSLIKNFVKIIEKFSEVYVEPHINIVIDELDQLNEKYNISHFIKVISENLDKKEISSLSFILVGQMNLFNRLTKQQPAFSRLVKHFKLQPLNDENARYVLEACLTKTRYESKIETIIDDRAKALLLGLSSGYPHSIHLLGHEAFNCAQERYEKIPEELFIIQKDVLFGLKKALIGETERYKEIIKSLNQYEKQCLIIMAGYHKKIPMEYQAKDIEEGIAIKESEHTKKIVFESLKGLCEKQILHELSYDSIVKNFEDIKFGFCEEIFRVYLSDLRQNTNELDDEFY